MSNVTRLPARNDGGVHRPEAITPAEMKTILGWLGLTTPWFAARCKVQERQVARWMDGQAPIPDYAAARLIQVWNDSAEHVTRIVAEAVKGADPEGVVVLWTYRVDEDTNGSDYPASWHRALAGRAMDHLLMRTKYRVQIRFTEKENP